MGTRFNFGPTPARLSAEDGFSFIELLVAIVLLAGGIIALVGTLDGSRALSNTSERLSAATKVAERELERLTSRQFSWSELALTSAPTTAREPDDPFDNYPDLRVCSGPTYRFDQTPCPAGAPFGDELVVGGAGTIAPTDPWSDARTTGARGVVHRYITWVDDACPDAPRTSGCAGAQSYKRATVAVSVKNGPPDRPVVLSALIPNPDGLPVGTFPNPYTQPDLEY